MAISIIIPTKDRLGILAETLEHIYHNYNPAAENIEVIVINDGTERLDYLLQKYKNLQIHQNKRKGAASARNTGAHIANNDVLLFMDDDMLIGADCLQKHINLHTQYPRSLVSGSWQYTPDMISLFKKSAFGRYKLKNDYRALQGSNNSLLSEGLYASASLASFNLSIVRADFELLNGFNESFPYAGCEDQEFAMRAKENGFRLILDSTNIAVNNEKDRADMGKWLKRQYTGVQGYPLLCELFPERKKETLFVENTPAGYNDSFKLMLKKWSKYIFSRTLLLNCIKYTTLCFAQLKFNDIILFRCYKILSGLYIYKGFRLSYSALHKNKKI